MPPSGASSLIVAPVGAKRLRRLGTDRGWRGTAPKLEHARKSGRKFGRPAKLTSDQAAQRMKNNGETAATICETLVIGRTTLYRYLAESAEDLSISRQPSA